MARPPRILPAGYCYHVINRGNRRSIVFHQDADYKDFLAVLREGQERFPLGILAICLMPNHFHFVVRPTANDELSRFMHWSMTTHAVRYHKVHSPNGRIWQGRFKAFAIQEDSHLIAVMRYVERNALRAGLVRAAEDWPWGSLAWRASLAPPIPLQATPGGLPADWVTLVNEAQTTVEIDALRLCIQRQRPFGHEPWARQTAQRLGIRPMLPLTPVWGRASKAP